MNEKVFMDLLDDIEEEVEGARKYAIRYNIYKREYPAISEMYRQLAGIELNHVEKLRENIRVYYMNYDKDHPNADLTKMMTLKEYVCDKAMTEMENIKNMIR